MERNENMRKVVYEDNSDCVIKLKEYLVFEKDDHNNTYVILKFINEYKESVHSINFEVKEYNEKNIFIRKSNFIYDDFEALPGKEFVPFTKLKVSNSCNSIDVTLVSAQFELASVVEEQLIEPVVAVEEEKPIDEEESIEENKKKFFIKDAIKRGRIKYLLMGVFFAIAATIICVVSFVELSAYKQDVKYLNYEGFHVEIEGKGGVITKYEGLETIITIPDKILGYSIIAIGTNAFKDSAIESLTFTANTIEIRDYAFLNCDFLQEITASNISTIGENSFESCDVLSKLSIDYIGTISKNAFKDCQSLAKFEVDVNNIEGSAFYNCTKLTELNLEKTTIGNSALYGIINLEKLTFGSTSCTSLGNIFGCENKELPASLTQVTTSMPKITIDFFSNAKIKTIDITNDDAIVDLGAFKNCGYVFYSLTDDIEIVNGIVVSVNKNAEEIVIPAGTTGITTSAFNGFLGRSLTINCSNYTLEKGVLDGCKRLDTLKISDTVKVGPNALTSISSLVNLEMPVSQASFTQVVSVTNSSQFECIKITGTTAIPNDYFNVSFGVKELIVANSVPSIGTMAFGSLRVEKLTIPNQGPLKQLGNFAYLKDVTITNSNSTRIETNFFYDLSNLEKITLPSNIGSVLSNAIDNCPKLQAIVFPSNIYSFELPVIGKNCTSLASVSAPFIGPNPTTSNDYSMFNLSYRYTKELEISTDVSIAALFTDSNNYLTSLKLNKAIDSFDSMVLTNCLKLKTLEVNELNNNCLGDLFYGGVTYLTQNEFIPKTLKTVKVNGGMINSNYFYNCKNIKNIILNDVIAVGSDAFTGCVELTNLYISATVEDTRYVAGLNNTVFNNTLNVYYENENSISFNSSINKYTKANMNSNSYEIILNNVSYELSGLYVDLDQIKNLDYNSTKYTIRLYADASYNRIISDYSHVNNGDILYARLVEYYYITGYAFSSINVKYYSDNSLYLAKVLNNYDMLENIVLNKSGYLFTGWYTEESCNPEDRFDFQTSPTQDIVLYAGWQKAEAGYSVTEDNAIINLAGYANYLYYTFVASSTGTIIIQSFGAYDDDVVCSINGTYTSISNGGRMSIPVVEGEVYQFILSKYNNDSSTIVVTNTNERTAGVIINTSYNKLIFEDTQVIAGSYNVVLDVPVIPGYVFKGWYTQENGQGYLIADFNGNITNSIYINSNLTVYAFLIRN